MPLLDFQCGKCGNKFDELVYTSQMDKVTCPECGSRDVKRVYEGKCYLACWVACQIPEGVPEEAVVDAADAALIEHLFLWKI